jgi:hypothetical protein
VGSWNWNQNAGFNSAMALAQYLHPWFLSKAKAIMNLNIKRSQGVGGGGFLLLLLKSEREILNLQVSIIFLTLGVGTIHPFSFLEGIFNTYKVPSKYT